MLCRKCGKKNATVFYKQNINGEVKEYALCSDCAANLQGELPQNLFSPNFGLNLFESFFGGAQNHQRGIAAGKACTLCGSSFSDILRDGRVGCAKCYEIFSDELDSSIQQIHGNVSHNGRAPGAHREKNEKKRRLADLKKQLNAAVAGEEYERAAELRDEIRHAEEEGI